ncbi:unnamed protein product [Sympodiomycopsis kandeliae]
MTGKHGSSSSALPSSSRDQKAQGNRLQPPPQSNNNNNNNNRNDTRSRPIANGNTETHHASQSYPFSTSPTSFPSSSSFQSRFSRAPSVSGRSFATTTSASGNGTLPSRLNITSPAASTSSASNSTLTIGRSSANDTQGGGAAARLRRVASNASIAASVRSMRPVKEDNEQPAQSSSDQSQRQDPSSSNPAIPDAVQPSNPAGPHPPSSSSSIAEDQPAQPGGKRSHLRAEPVNRATARRKTWFGWTQDDDDKIADATPASDTSQPPPRSDPVDAAAAQQEQADIHDSQKDPSQATLRPIRSNSTEEQAKRARRVLWLGWRVPQDVSQASDHQAQSSQPEAEPPVAESSQSAQDDQASQPQSGAQPVESPPEARQAEVSAGPQPPPQGSWLWGLWNRSANTSIPTQTNQNTGDAVDQDVMMPDAEPTTTDAEGDTYPTQSTATPQTESQPHPQPASWTSWIPSWGNAPPASSSSPVGDEAVPSTTPLTPAEQVKAEALARPDPSTTPFPTITPRDAVINPATRSSWISYFSSKSARPAAKIESDEPENMEIDFNEDPAVSSGRNDDTIKASKGKPSAATAALAVKAVTAAKAGQSESAPVSANSSRPVSPRPHSTANPSPKPDPAPPSSRPVTPLTGDVKAGKKGNKKGPPGPPPAPIPNLVLPTFDDTFFTTPRSIPPPAGMLKRTLSAVNTWLGGGGGQTASSASLLRSAPRLRGSIGNAFQEAAGPLSSSSVLSSSPTPSHSSRHDTGRSSSSTNDVGLALAEQAASRLPRAWETLGHRSRAEKQGCEGIRRVCIVALHGWFAQSWASRFMGEPTGTSLKFAMEMREAVLRHFSSVDGMELNPEAISMIPLSADGTVQERTDRSFGTLLNRKEWVQDLKEADAIFFACHSQGCIVGTNLLARLIEQQYILPRKTRIALLGMCGIHSGPFEHLRSTVVSSYVNYFETAAAKELFEFQKPHSQVSKQYESSLKLALDAGTKIIWIASTDDQVVPLHSALFTSANHPSILRGLYIHGATFPKLDFLTNMLTFCVAVRNAGLSDHDLLALLSSSVAGSLYGGLGHSLAYDEPKIYDLAVSYLLRVSHPLSPPSTRSDESHPPSLHITSGNEPKRLNNPHLLPWSLRGILEDQAVRSVFATEMNKLLDDFTQWKPLTKTLRDVQYRLEPMRSVPRPAMQGDSNAKGKGKGEVGNAKL